MNEVRKISSGFVCLMALVASAFGADVGNFVWNGGFEESYIYWANGKGENGNSVSQSLGLRAKEYGDINGKEVRLEHWTGTAGIADKDAGVNEPKDPNFCTSERYLTIHKLQYAEQVIELPVQGTYEVSFRHCMHTGNSIELSLTDEDGVLKYSSDTITPSSAAKTFEGSFDIENPGRYCLKIEGKVNSSVLVCIDDIRVALKEASTVFGAVDFKLPRYDRLLLQVRALDYGQGDALTQVDYKIAKHGEEFGSEWTKISDGLAKETEFDYLVTGLEIDTEYDYQVRFSNGDQSFVCSNTIRTTKELLENGGFEDCLDFLKVSSVLNRNVNECDGAVWSGSGVIVNRAYASVTGNIAPDSSQAKDLITSNVYAYVWKDRLLQQSITVPVKGIYKVSYKYAAAKKGEGAQNNYIRQDHTTAVEYVGEDGDTTTLFLEAIANEDFSLHTCERLVALPEGKFTFQLRGIVPTELPEDRGIATCYDDISIQLVQAGSGVFVHDVGYDYAKFNFNLDSEDLKNGGVVDLSLVYSAHEMTLGSHYESLLSELDDPEIYPVVVAGLYPDTTYYFRFRIRNSKGDVAYVDRSLTTGHLDGPNVIRNGGFEEGSEIVSGDVGDMYLKEGKWPATTSIWKLDPDQSIYHHGIAKPKSNFSVNNDFTLGNFSGFIFQNGAFEQDIVVPETGRYKLAFRYGKAHNHSARKYSFKISVSVAQKDKVNEICSIDGPTADNSTHFVPDNAEVELQRGEATFTIRQTQDPTQLGMASCYDNISLKLVALAHDRVEVVSQNPAVTGGMYPEAQIFYDIEDGATQTFSADATWVDPSTGEKYTCTGWKLYRNGVLVNQAASLSGSLVHVAGENEKVVWGWKPWAASDTLLSGKGLVLIVR